MRHDSGLCYNFVMGKSPYALVVLAWLLATGCALSDSQDGTGPSGASQVAFAQVKAAPDAHRGQAVTFGGKVLGARRLKEGTRIEILQLPLTSSLQPSFDLSKSQGRFVAIQKEFLDPATVPAGTFVTVTGEVIGSVTMPLDETEYTSVIVEIKTLRVWPRDEDAYSRTRPYIGPSLYWDPYWSPYWRPWPYW